MDFPPRPGSSRPRREARQSEQEPLPVEPEPADAASAFASDAPRSWPETETVPPLASPAATLAEAGELGPSMLATAGAHLRRLLGEIAARAPLANGGVIREIRP